jgi:hypothetical protein
MSNPAYFVKDNHTLGYVTAEQPHLFCILHGSVLLGGHSWLNGPVHIFEDSSLVPATLADFDRFRVHPGGHLSSEPATASQ